MIFKAAVLMSICFGLTACPNLVKKPKSKSGAKVITVKGDPNIFIKDTVLNGVRALPVGISSVKVWELAASGFQEEAVITDVDAVVKEQTPKESDAPTVYPLEARAVNDQLIIEGQFAGAIAHFIFSRTPNGWALYSYKWAGRTGVIGQSGPQIIHTSVLADLSAFSLLLQDNSPGKKMVASLNFIRQKSIVKRMGDKLYEYYFGKGVKVGWTKQKNRTMLICGNLPEPVNQIVAEEAQRWNTALQGKLKLQAVARTSCPPFSDLNSQTFAFTTDWIEIAGEHAVAAQTLNIAGEGRGEFIDGDIFYLLGEYQEHPKGMLPAETVISPQFVGTPEFQQSLRKVTLHEMGHFLGLHHQFNPAVSSIMSYSKDKTAKLYDYDIKAIQALYAD